MSQGRTTVVAVNALNVRPGIVDGAITVALNLLATLPAARPDWRFVAFVRPGEDRLNGVDGLELHRVHAADRIGGRVLWETVGLSRELRRLRADVLLAPYESVPLAAPCPLVVIAQNLFYHRPGLAEAFAGGSARERFETRARIAYYRRRMPNAYARAARVVAVSAETARVLGERAGLPALKTSIVHEGSDSRWLPQRERAAQPADRVLVVSGLMPYKNHELALAVLRELRRNGAGPELSIVGADWRGYRAVLEARAAGLAVDGAVRFHGAVSPDELADLYATSALLLHLSEWESFGLPVLEAMRYGLPVVAANRSSLPEIAGGAAALVEPTDPRAIAGVIHELRDVPARAEALAASGRKRAGELTWRAFAEGVARALAAALEPAR